MSDITNNDISNNDIVTKINSGEVGVIPTDTVYGLVAKAANPTAVEKLYSLKRHHKKPGTIIAADIDQLVDLGLKKRYLSAVQDYWPGAVSVVIPCGIELGYLHNGLQSLAVRIPDDTDLQALLRQTGPLLTTSANLPGEQPAETAEQARTVFGDKVDFYVGGGSLAGHKPSTVIRVVDDAVEVLRSGAVTIGANGEVEGNDT